MSTTTGRTSEQAGVADDTELLPPVPPRPVNLRYESYLHDWSKGFHARDAEIARLVAERDRLYRELYAPHTIPTGPTRAQVEARRQADRDAFLAAGGGNYPGLADGQRNLKGTDG